MFRISKNNRRNVEGLKGRRVAVLGAGRSGIALTELLVHAGARVLLSDLKPLEALALPESLRRRPEVEIETGGHSQAVLESDLICISPGLPLEIPILRDARNLGITIAGEIEVASWFCRSPMIAITGSNGKTTTTTLAGEMFRRAIPDTVVAGNIGNAFAEAVNRTTPEGVAILEISSFQLETIWNFHPRVAVIMNLTANHLDRYPDFEAYARAKLNVLKNMGAEDVLIYNADDPLLQERLSDALPQKLHFSLEAHDTEGAYWKDESIVLQINGREETIALSKYQLRGPHNRYNMMVAALLARLWQVPVEAIQQAVAEFPGIEHRLEKAGEKNGVVFINDSKATTVDSLGYALRSFREKLVLIAGGKDKGGDFSRLRLLLQQKVRAAVLIGQAAERIAREWEGAVPLLRAESLREAVELAYRQAQPGDVVILSPACSSFDMFQDYEHRGRVFKEIVKELTR